MTYLPDTAAPTEIGWTLMGLLAGSFNAYMFTFWIKKLHRAYLNNQDGRVRLQLQ